MDGMASNILEDPEIQRPNLLGTPRNHDESRECRSSMIISRKINSTDTDPMIWGSVVFPHLEPNQSTM